MLLRPGLFFFFNWIILFAFDELLMYVEPTFYPVEYSVYFYALTVSLFVLMGGRASNFFFAHNVQRLVFIPVFIVQEIMRARSWIFILTFIFLVTGLERYLMVGAEWYTPDGVNAYRYMVTEDGENRLFSLLNYFNFFIFFSGAYLVYFYEKISLKQKILFVILLCALLYINSARSTAFFVILISLFVYLLSYGFKVWMIYIPFVLIALFIFIGAISGKDDPFSFVTYYLAPIHAFSELFVDSVPLGENYQLLSFRFLHSLFVDLGIIDNPAIMLPYIETPLPTNVYTALYVYWHDLGWYSFIFWFVMGFLFDLTYRWYVRSKCFSSIAMLSMLLTCIVLSVFYDYFTSSAFVYVSAFILIALNSSSRKI